MPISGAVPGFPGYTYAVGAGNTVPTVYDPTGAVLRPGDYPGIDAAAAVAAAAPSTNWWLYAAIAGGLLLLLKLRKKKRA